MAYTRDNPSPRYRSLNESYRRMHREGDAALNIPAQSMFPGISLFPQLPHVKRLIARTRAQSVLDYGSGKGLQYQTGPIRVDGEAGEWDSVADYWDVDYVACYDPCYPPYSELPGKRFEGVISTDVLEHCPEEDLPWIVDELFALAEKFVFVSIAGYPARKQLPSGENAHCTVQPLQWWQALFSRAAAGRADVIWRIRYFRPAAPGAPLAVDEAGSELAGGSA
jgi:hypothetical protein